MQYIFNIFLVLIISYNCSYAQTSGWGIATSCPVMLPALITPIEGQQQLNSTIQPTYQFSFFYDRYINNGWGLYTSLGVGALPMEFYKENIQEGVIFNQSYLSSSINVSYRRFLDEKTTIFYRGGIALFYQPYTIETYDLDARAPIGGPTYRIQYPEVIYGTDKRPVFGAEAAIGYEWHLGKSHYLLLDANAVFTGQDALRYTYIFDIYGQKSKGLYQRKFNYIGVNFSYKYIFKNTKQ
jgi:hypothetical protein